jgi:ABC-type microcin C transport system duplicated ATPase subunit YejF
VYSRVLDLCNLNPTMKVGAQIVGALEVHGRASGEQACLEARGAAGEG